MTKKIRLGDIAHARTGDKGNSLGCGCPRRLAMDKHGKSLGMALLEMEL